MLPDHGLAYILLLMEYIQIYDESRVRVLFTVTLDRGCNFGTHSGGAMKGQCIVYEVTTLQ